MQERLMGGAGSTDNRGATVGEGGEVIKFQPSEKPRPFFPHEAMRWQHWQTRKSLYFCWPSLTTRLAASRPRVAGSTVKSAGMPCSFFRIVLESITCVGLWIGEMFSV